MAPGPGPGAAIQEIGSRIVDVGFWCQRRGDCPKEITSCPVQGRF